VSRTGVDSQSNGGEARSSICNLGSVVRVVAPLYVQWPIKLPLHAPHLRATRQVLQASSHLSKARLYDVHFDIVTHHLLNLSSPHLPSQKVRNAMMSHDFRCDTCAKTFDAIGKLK
jgi:hypothetical protein